MNMFASNVLAETEESMGTTRGLEWMYSRTGNRLHGETEMRLAWKWNDLKPRVYYARGPSQYYASRYIQEIFNELIDALPITNRFFRFFHAGIRLDANDNLFIYDYSSFTSSLEEVKCFIRSLAFHCRGTTISILDTYHGIRIVDLGDVLMEYLEECNNFPVYDINRWPEECVEEDTLRRNSTGMLGVPGNITSCTLLHGIHLAMILESLLKGKCVGDDAIAAKDVDEDQFEKDIKGLGDVSMAKGATWLTDDEYAEEDLTWNYVKRSLTRIDNRIVVGDLLTFPTIGAFFNLNDGIHTHIDVDAFTLAKKQATMLWRLCRSTDELGRELTEEEAEMVDQFVYVMSKETSMIRDRESFRHIPIICPRGYEKGTWKRSMLIDVWNTPVYLPKGDFGDFDRPEIIKEYEVETRSSKALKVARDMGWAEVDSLYEYRIPSLDHDYFDRWLNRELRGHVRVFIRRSCPDFMLDLINGRSKLSEPQHLELYDTIDEDDDFVHV
jgi:hypothetical protein